MQFCKVKIAISEIHEFCKKFFEQNLYVQAVHGNWLIIEKFASSEEISFIKMFFG